MGVWDGAPRQADGGARGRPNPARKGLAGGDSIGGALAVPRRRHQSGARVAASRQQARRQGEPSLAAGAAGLDVVEKSGAGSRTGGANRPLIVGGAGSYRTRILSPRPIVGSASSEYISTAMAPVWAWGMAWSTMTLAPGTGETISKVAPSPGPTTKLCNPACLFFGLPLG